LSTALFVLGTREGTRVISHMPNVSAVFVEQGADDGVVITTAGKLAGLTRLSH